MLDSSNKQPTTLLWKATQLALFGFSAAAFTGAMVLGAHAQHTPETTVTLPPLPHPPQIAYVQLPDDPFEPLVTRSLEIHRNTPTYNGATASSAPGTFSPNDIAVARLCTTFLNDPRSAVIQVAENWITVDLRTHSTIGNRRVIAIGANAIELDNGTIIEQGDCTPTATQQQPVANSDTNGNTYQPNPNGVLIPGPTFSATAPPLAPDPYAAGNLNLNNTQPNNPLNNLYGSTPPPTQGFPPFVRTLPGSPAQIPPQ
jgi:hypothetical protein